MLRFSSATLIALLTLAGTAHAAPSVATVPNYNIKAACRALVADTGGAHDRPDASRRECAL